jgi:hypothetical protein
MGPSGIAGLPKHLPITGREEILQSPWSMMTWAFLLKNRISKGDKDERIYVLFSSKIDCFRSFNRVGSW